MDSTRVKVVINQNSFAFLNSFAKRNLSLQELMLRFQPFYLDDQRVNYINIHVMVWKIHYSMI
jgi:hypothetical protein